LTLEQAPTSGQRRRLIELLRQSYRNEWSELLRDFEPAPDVETWQDLEQHGVLFLRPGGDGVRVQRKFLRMVAERYYFLVHDIIRKYDRRALILGDRFQSFYYPEVARACLESPTSSAPTGSNITTNRRTGGLMARISTSAWWTFTTGLTNPSRPRLQRSTSRPSKGGLRTRGRMRLKACRPRRPTHWAT